jgi:hypothetical protein
MFAYAAPTADATGPGAEVATIEMAGIASSMIAMPDGTVYAFSSNACRLVPVKPDGTGSEPVRPPEGEQVPRRMFRLAVLLPKGQIPTLSSGGQNEPVNVIIEEPRADR